MSKSSTGAQPPFVLRPADKLHSKLRYKARDLPRSLRAANEKVGAFILATIILLVLGYSMHLLSEMASEPYDQVQQRTSESDLLPPRFAP